MNAPDDGVGVDVGVDVGVAVGFGVGVDVALEVGVVVAPGFAVGVGLDETGDAVPIGLGPVPPPPLQSTRATGTTTKSTTSFDDRRRRTMTSLRMDGGDGIFRTTCEPYPASAGRARARVSETASSERARPTIRYDNGFLSGVAADERTMATWHDVRRIVNALPETSETSASGGTAAWTVRGKAFAWERPLRKSDLAALGPNAPQGAILGLRTVDLEMKEALLASDPTAFFTTPHFDGYCAVLVVLAKIRVATLRDAIVESWLARAPKRAADAYLAAKRPRASDRTL